MVWWLNAWVDCRVDLIQIQDESATGWGAAGLKLPAPAPITSTSIGKTLMLDSNPCQ